MRFHGSCEAIAHRPAALALVVMACGFFVSSAQTADEQKTTSTLTLRAESRLVIEDVLVTDRDGNPVHGLPASAFHVTDNRKPQTIQNFEEAATTTSAESGESPELPPGTFSNASYLGSAKAVSEIFLVDADDLEPVTQLFLLSELKQAIAAMPTGMQAGLFCVRGGRPVQVRGMTRSRDDLSRALSECVPSIEHTGVDAFGSAVNQILTVASFLQPIPGRKSVLWFAGPFPLVPVTTQEQQPGGISVNAGGREHLIQQLQETLAEARVAIYPVDPRGVLTTGLAMPGAPVNQESNRSMGVATNVDGARGVPLPDGVSDMGRYDYMRSLAQATGGKAYILNNLKEEVEQAFELSRSAYTLSYAPHEYANDGSWHDIMIRVDGPYTLSYRRGYLAVWNADVRSVAARLLQTSGTRAAETSGADPSKPLLFTIKTDDAPVASGAKQSGQLAFTFSVPPGQLGFALEAGKWKDEFVVASYTYDERGNLKGGEQQEVDVALTPEQWEQAQAKHIHAREAFRIPKSSKYVLFVVRDKRSRRSGTLMLTTRALAELK